MVPLALFKSSGFRNMGLLVDCSARDEIVFDGVLGSGTLIATVMGASVDRRGRAGLFFNVFGVFGFWRGGGFLELRDFVCWG